MSIILPTYVHKQHAGPPPSVLYKIRPLIFTEKQVTYCRTYVDLEADPTSVSHAILTSKERRLSFFSWLYDQTIFRERCGCSFTVDWVLGTAPKPYI